MRLIATLGVVLAVAGCSGGIAEITGPVESTFIANGVEQELRIAPVDASVDPTGKMFHLTSRLVNRGTDPVTLRVVTCWLDPKLHLRTRARFNSMAIPGCVGEPDVITLAPGEASGTVWFSGQIENAGRYTIAVRHSLDPEFWGEIQVTAR